MDGGGGGEEEGEEEEEEEEEERKRVAHAVTQHSRRPFLHTQALRAFLLPGKKGFFSPQAAYFTRTASLLYPQLCAQNENCCATT